MLPEDSPALSSEYDSRRPNSLRGQTKVSHVRDGSGRPRSGTRVKGKGKRRASTRSLSPSESGSPVAHERIATPEVLAAPMSFLENTPERNTAASCTPARETSPPKTPESNSGGTPVVSPHGNPNIAHATHATNNIPLPLEGLRSLNHRIIASSSSNSETPETPTINIDRARANPMRQPRYRSQRDSIIAHLRGSVITPRPTPNLLARMTDQTVAKPNVSGDDADVAKRTGGMRHVELPSQTAERSSGLSDSDDPSWGSHPKEAAVTKAGARLCSICTVSCLATRALTLILRTLLTFLQKRPRHPRRVLPTRIYLAGFMTRRLRPRKRGYAHRHDSARVLPPSAGCSHKAMGGRGASAAAAGSR